MSELAFAHHQILAAIPRRLNGRVEVKEKMEASSPRLFLHPGAVAPPRLLTGEQARQAGRQTRGQQADSVMLTSGQVTTLFPPKFWSSID